MKILFCSPCAIDPRLGAAQTLIALAEELRLLGHDCDLVGPDTLQTDLSGYPEQLYAHLQAHASSYDVIDFDYKRLLFARSDFPQETLFVARCQLLLHHFLRIEIPTAKSLRAQLRAFLLDARDHRIMEGRVRKANQTLQAADLVVVLNPRDEETLQQEGIPADKIRVTPNGMAVVRHEAFGMLSEEIPAGPPVVGFIGMYGPRKGSTDMPALVQRVVEAIPEVRFRLLGTKGMLNTEAEVLATFPRSLRPHLEVIPSFAPEELPGLLAPCSVGVFPSYMEGFGLGVLEMLAAAMPVIAYDAPGPPIMLTDEYLVPLGDTATMADKVIRLLQNPTALAQARQWARARSLAFQWKPIAVQLASIYQEALTRQKIP